MKTKYILTGVVLLLIASQFVRIGTSLPVSDPDNDFLTANATDTVTAELIRHACYDCHSNETEYPWYAQIAPVSWWIQHHIREGREHLNFSEWTGYPSDKKAHKMEECMEMVKEGEMPMASFTWLHPEAKLTDEQKVQLTSYFGTLQGPQKSETEKH